MYLYCNVPVQMARNSLYLSLNLFLLAPEKEFLKKNTIWGHKVKNVKLSILLPRMLNCFFAKETVVLILHLSHII